VGIQRPVVAGTMLGEVESADRLVSTSGAQDGDSIIVTVALGIEGTAVLARECAADLLRAGLGDDVIARAADYLSLPGISIVSAAQALCGAINVHSLHDITEGGVITALREVASASNLGLVVEGETMPVLPETVAICDALEIDVLGLLGSGALIATMPSSEVPRALRALDQIGITGWEVGQMMEADEGLWLIDRTGDQPLPEFRRDELARYLESRAQTA
jgi:hydrogenase expression/formation protein HypE